MFFIKVNSSYRIPSDLSVRARCGRRAAVRDGRILFSYSNRLMFTLHYVSGQPAPSFLRAHVFALTVDFLRIIVKHYHL